MVNPAEHAALGNDSAACEPQIHHLHARVGKPSTFCTRQNTMGGPILLCLCTGKWQAAAYGILANLQVFSWTPGPFVSQTPGTSHGMGLIRISVEHSLLLGRMRLDRPNFVAKNGYTFLSPMGIMLRHISIYCSCHTNNCVRHALASASFFHHLKGVQYHRFDNCSTTSDTGEQH